MLSELYEHYTIENPEKIIEFVEKDLNILDFIYEITSPLEKYFPDCEKVLEFIEDSEFECLNKIMIYVIGSDYQKDFITLKEFEKEPVYLSKYKRKIYGKVSVAVRTMNNTDFNKRFNELSQYYELYNPEQLKSFIRDRENALEFIHEITPLMNEYFPNYDKVLEFCEDPEFESLNSIIIYIKGNDYHKDKLILNKFVKEPLYRFKFAKKINGLVSVSLW